MELKLYLLCIIVIHISGAFCGWRRPCRMVTRGRPEVINKSYRYVPYVVKNASSTTVQLRLEISWNVSVPEGMKLDGFLMNMQLSGAGRKPPSLAPLDVCIPRPNNFWVRTQDGGACSKNETCRSVSDQTFCQCSQNCSLIGEVPKCMGVSDYWIPTFKTIALPASTRKATFDVDFNRNYGFMIFPYYRQYAWYDPRRLSISPTDCVKLLTEFGRNDSMRICCDASIKQYLPSQAAFQYPVINFDTGTINATLTWLAPLTRFALQRYKIYANGKRFFVNATSNQNTLFTDRTSNGSLTNSCTNTNELVSLPLTGFLPQTTYRVLIESVYSISIFACARSCRRDLFELTVPELDPCAEEFYYCHENSTCFNESREGNGTERTTGDKDMKSNHVLNATCLCNNGFTGNGINTIWNGGEGCKHVDYCSLAFSPCVSLDHCARRIAPEIGAKCSCPAYQYGDGYKHGSGCASILPIALPVALASAMLVVFIIGGLYVKGRAYQKERQYKKWSQFVTDAAWKHIEQFIGYDEKNPCAPTFGEKFELDRDRLILGDILGRGKFGVVHYGQYGLSDDVEGECEKREVAVKTIQEGPNEKENMIELLAEIAFMLNVGKHPNIVEMIGCCTTQKPLLLVVEYLKYGDLLHFLWDARSPKKREEDEMYNISEMTLYTMAKQIAQGMVYLSKRRFIHGDLAARNILVGEGLVCKIFDFGLACDAYKYGFIKNRAERCVPYKWISPERMLEGKLPVTSNSDVWSYGNLMYEMVTLGCAPYPDISCENLLDNLKSGYRMPQPNTCSQGMYSIMSSCWKWHAYSRPTFADIVKRIDRARAEIKDDCKS